MTTDKLRFLIGLDRPSSHVGHVIAWFTWGAYSHAKMMFLSPDGQRVVIESRSDRGVIEREHDPAGRDARTEWFMADLPRPEAALDFARRQVGKGYDRTMWFRFLTRTREGRIGSGRWFCSELAYATAIEGGLWLLRISEPWKISPSWLGASPLLHGPVIVPEA